MVTKQSDGTWKVDISGGLSSLTGKRVRHRKSGFKTKKEAEQYESEYRLFKLDQISRTEKYSIKYFYALVLEEDELRGNKQRTRDTQESYYNQYVSSYFSKADMSKVSTKDLKEFRNFLLQQPSVKGGNLTNLTVNQYMIFMHKLFDVAIAHQIRSDNPCDNLKKLPEKHKEMSYYTPEQFKEFDSHFKKEEYQFQLFFRMLMYTGMRMGEALALTWNDVNLSQGYIEVSKSSYYKKKKTIVGTVKTTQSNRRIYIHQAFIEELYNWKKKQRDRLKEFTKDFSNLQVYQSNPEPLTSPNVSNFRVSFQKRLPLHLPMIRNHDFRHSHAAFLVNQGLRNGEGKDYIFFTLMKRLGHSSINTTVNIYSHLFPSQQKEAANAFDNF